MDILVYITICINFIYWVVTIHEERIVHGSPGNVSTVPRKTYVIAFRSVATVEHERSIGFNHSHNTEQNWDTFISQTALNKITT